MLTGRILVTLLTGTAGALLARRFRTPGGSLLGAMLAAGAWSLAASEAQPLPEVVRSLALLFLGMYTGSSMDPKALRAVRKVLPACMLAVLVLIALGGALGWLLQRYFAPDMLPVTAILGTMPGGASGLTAIAYDLGAEPRLVASIHMVRLIIVFGVLPLALARFVRPGRGHAGDGH
jgi:membrane AbrB-like protein